MRFTARYQLIQVCLYGVLQNLVFDLSESLACPYGVKNIFFHNREVVCMLVETLVKKI